MTRFLKFLIPFLWFITIQSQSVSLNAIIDRLTNGTYERIKRPQFLQSPTIIKSQYRIDRISNINPISNSFELDLILRLQWVDTRLQYNETLDQESLRVEPSQIWVPDVYFLNEMGKMEVLDSTLKVSNDGTVFWSRHYIMSFASPFNLGKFPFDSQVLPLKLISYSHNQDTLTLSFYDDLEGGPVYPSLAGRSLLLWSVNRVDTKRELITFRENTRPFDLLQLDIFISRLPNTYLLKYIIPLYFIGVCSSIGYWIDVTALPTRGGFAVSLLLSTVTLNFVMTSDLPKVSYSTALDTFITTVFGFVLVSLLEYAVVHVLATSIRNSIKLTRHIDITFRFSPIPLSCFSLYIFTNDGGILSWILWSFSVLFPMILIIYRIFVYVRDVSDLGRQFGRGKREDDKCDANGDGDTGNLVMIDCDASGGDVGAI
ncbi:neurotransmitter-gated ion-channel ligand-binding domain-containing protein [Globomyces pollinis-pini]|nr:neurotransmitter-gated ion-channel ligand-binding domain-containing protein [Globomyces pollinis-pini]